MVYAGEKRYKTGRERVRFPNVSLKFFIDIRVPAAIWAWVSLNITTEMSKVKQYHYRP
jgi:hypothetical protein